MAPKKTYPWSNQNNTWKLFIEKKCRSSTQDVLINKKCKLIKVKSSAACDVFISSNARKIACFAIYSIVFYHKIFQSKTACKWNTNPISAYIYIYIYIYIYNIIYNIIYIYIYIYIYICWNWICISFTSSFRLKNFMVENNRINGKTSYFARIWRNKHIAGGTWLHLY